MKISVSRENQKKFENNLKNCNDKKKLSKNCFRENIRIPGIFFRIFEIFRFDRKYISNPNKDGYKILADIFFRILCFYIKFKNIKLNLKI